MKGPQTDGRRKNGAIPGGRPDATTPDAAIRRVGLHERTTAGPDGPDATEVGNLFKRKPSGSAPADGTA